MLSALGKVVPSAHSMHRITSRGYHVTGAVLARKGSSAFVEKPRDFSKKQKKRFKKKMMLKGEHDKRNSTRGGAANELISQQLRSPETQELIETTGDRCVRVGRDNISCRVRIMHTLVSLYSCGHDVLVAVC